MIHLIPEHATTHLRRDLGKARGRSKDIDKPFLNMGELCQILIWLSS